MTGTTDRRPQTPDQPRRAGGWPERTRGFLVFALAVLVSACGGGKDTANRDRLPRRTPAPADTSVQAPDPPPEETPAIPPLRDDFFESMADYERQRAAALAELEDAIGTPRAMTVAECRAVPVGEKPCGGPWSFLVSSATGEQELAVIQRAARTAALDREANEQFGIASGCELVPEPEIVVENGVCVAR